MGEILWLIEEKKKTKKKNKSQSDASIPNGHNCLVQTIKVGLPLNMFVSGSHRHMKDVSTDTRAMQ